MVEKRTVLFVDDDEIILRSIKRGFLDELYNQLFAKSGKEALEILQKEEVHIIVTDMRMPDMDGLALLKIVREMYPHIIKIVLSGYADMSTFQTEFNEGEIFSFICKPWKLEADFKKVIQQALEHYNLQNECETIPQSIP
jgi:DNA-binding NtrC family response regulator